MKYTTNNEAVIDDKGGIVVIADTADDALLLADCYNRADDLLAASEALLEKIGYVCGIEPERRALISAINKAYGEGES